MRRAIAILAVCGFAATALAQSRHELARAHYKAGASYYQRGRYTDAIREFEQSYELSRKPDILYNLAHCYDKLGKRDKVVGYLRRYLKEKPKAEDREQVEAWLGNLERALAEDRAAVERAAADRRAVEERAAADRRVAAEQAAADRHGAETRAAADRHGAETRAAADRAAAERAAETRAAADKAAAGTHAATQGPAVRTTDAAPAGGTRGEPREAGSTWRIVGIVGIGVGLAAVVSSTVPAVLAYGKARNLEDKLKITAENPSPVFGSGLQSDYRQGPTLDRLFIGLAVAGSVIVVAGALALWYGKKLQRRLEARPVVGPRAGGVDLAWRF